jgi:hypothetical protein
MTRRDRLRRAVILCREFTRNLGYYRGAREHPAGWREEPLTANASFWRTTSNNFLDTCVLEWCKLFGGWKEEHYWGNVISNRARFTAELLVRLNITADDLESFRIEMRAYRDKFLAHLDSELVANIPKLDLARASVEFYHAYVIGNEVEPGDLSDLPDTADKLRLGYDECKEEAARVYQAI